MTYRGDQDALLARNDALEAENRRLRDELAKEVERRERQERRERAERAEREKPAPETAPAPAEAAVTTAAPRRARRPMPQIEPGLTVESAEKELAVHRHHMVIRSKLIMSGVGCVVGGAVTLLASIGTISTLFAIVGVVVLWVGMAIGGGNIPVGPGHSERTLFLERYLSNQRLLESARRPPAGADQT